MALFDKILVANRGEIAVRIIRTASRMGIRTVAIHAPEDAGAMHTRLADEVFMLKGDTLTTTYLDVLQIIELAVRSGVEAIHPGYGFLSENPEFAMACEKAGINFIGPSADAIRLMGNKLSAGNFVKELGIPVLEMIRGSKENLIRTGSASNFPLLVKAAAGGGGKGMRIVRSAENLEAAILSTAREAKAYFGNEEVYLEKYIGQPRHLEVQILGDNYGNVVHLFERECSIQRRFQKIIEETPASGIPENVREKIRNDAVTVAKGMKYRNAGTIEFLVGRYWDHYFLEMNTRLQVEHPVTEMTTGIDLVEQQIHIAAGESLSIDQESIRQSGHAMECRIYAEEPAAGFMPSPGRITLYREPQLEHVRMDSGIDGPETITPRFDPLIGKLIVWGKDREETRVRTEKALSEFIIHGISHNIPFLRALISHPDFRTNNISTAFCEDHLDDILQLIKNEPEISDHLLPACFYLVHQLYAEGKRESGSIWEEIGYWRQVMEIPVRYGKVELLIYILEKSGEAMVLETGGRVIPVAVLHCRENLLRLEIDGKRLDAFVSSGNFGRGWVSFDNHLYEFSRPDILQEHYEFTETGSGVNSYSGKIFSPMPGRVVEVRVDDGAQVSRGDILLVVEAMKMENNLTAPFDGKVGSVLVRQGQLVGNREMLVELIPHEKKV